MPNASASRSRWLTAGTVWSLIAAAAVVYFLLWPLVMLLLGAFRTSPFGAASSRWTLSGFITVFNDPWTPRTIYQTLIYSGFCTAGCMGLGLYLATVATRMATPLRFLITPAMVVLVATPRLFYGLAWGMLGNKTTGLFARMWEWLGFGALPDWMDVYTWQGLIIVSTIKLSAFSYLLLYGPVSRIDRSLEDAAVMAGVPRRRAFFDVTLTSLAPALLATGMLIFVEVMQAYDLPAVIGAPAGIHTLAIRVGDYINAEVQPNWAAASAFSSMLVVVVAALLLVQKSILRDKDYVTMGGKAAQGGLTPVGRWRWVVDGSILLYIALALVLPMIQVVTGSLQPFFGVYANWTFRNFAAILVDADLVRTMINTFVIAVAGGFLTIAISFGIAYLLRRRPDTWLAFLARIGSWVPATAPGIVLSLALLWSYLNTPGLKKLYGTPWLMMFALIIGSLPVAVRAIEGIIAQVGQDVEEAALVCGASPLASVLEITARLCRPSLIGAWFLVGLSIGGRLDVPLLFATANSHTVATKAFEMVTYGQLSQAAAMFLIYLTAGLALVAAAVLTSLGLRALLKRGAEAARRRNVQVAHATG